MTLSVRWQVSSTGSADSPNRRCPSVSSSGRTFFEDKWHASWLKTTSHELWKQRSNWQRGHRQVICPAGVVGSQRSDAKADASGSGARALSSPILVRNRTRLAAPYYAWRPMARGNTAAGSCPWIPCSHTACSRTLQALDAPGGLTSLAATWLTQRRKDSARRLTQEKTRRQKLYKQFMMSRRN